MVKIRIDIPIEAHLLCTTRCGINSAEYKLLKNGIVTRDADGREIVRILCDRDRAKKVLASIAQLCPEALPQIQQHPELPGEV